jgi:hypothetical protein
MAGIVEFDEMYALSNAENDTLWETLNSATDKIRDAYGKRGGAQAALYGELVSLRVDLTVIKAERMTGGYDNLP